MTTNTPTPPLPVPAMPPPRRPGDPVPGGMRTVAVIDMGTNSIRLNIADIDGEGRVHPVDSLNQPVELGKDTFTDGAISKSTISQVIDVLKRFRAVMEQYHVTQPEQIRAVATTAVREARNRDAFLDRIYVATGIAAKVIDAAEETRLTYQSIMPHIVADPKLASLPTLVIEVGGGTTEVLMLQNKDVMYSHSHRFGARRLREMLEKYRIVDARLRRLMERQGEVIVQQIRQNVELTHAPNIIILGGEARQAALHILGEGEGENLARLPVSALSKFVDQILSLAVEDIVRKFKLQFPEAETLAPTLLAYVQIARAMKARHLLVSKATMRDGLLVEMATGGLWSEEFFSQIVRSAMDLGRKYQFDAAHAVHVASVCRTMFEVLKQEHRLDPRYGLVLHVAALLHEIGNFVNSQGHHKHAMYLILNSELFGMGQRDLLMTGLIARYHRRAEPQPTHPEYAALDRESRIAVTKLAAILRVADALDRGHLQGARNITCTIQGGDFVITLPDVDDLSLEQVALHQKGAMFEDVYGMRVVLRKGQSPAVSA
ncbi:MAG: Ppx/GppA phosphatase family protein [Verrucomicrobia bacterium]|nr:Ppx/GppA phosphatase family protein [Verrucomicrobiota bacterium]